MAQIAGIAQLSPEASQGSGFWTPHSSTDLSGGHAQPHLPVGCHPPRPIKYPGVADYRASAITLGPHLAPCPAATNLGYTPMAVSRALREFAEAGADEIHCEGRMLIAK